MTNLIDFKSFPKLGRMSRGCVITEKLDGTNAQVVVSEDGLRLRAASRTRWISPTDDNFGFAKWVEENTDELLTLGPGQHFGEWWGRGIQRNYGLEDRRFSLFNPARWSDPARRPKCCGVVPVIAAVPFTTTAVDDAIEWMKRSGSHAVPGFMQPEGVVVFHAATRTLFKKTIDKDEEPKGKVAA